MSEGNRSNDDLEVPSPEDLGAEGEPDQLAQQEWDAMVANAPLVDAEGHARKRRIFRDIKLQDALHWSVRCFVRFSVLPVIGFIGVWAWHRIAPEYYRWLNSTDVDSLQTILFSGAISALVTIVGGSVFRGSDKE